MAIHFGFSRVIKIYTCSPGMPFALVIASDILYLVEYYLYYN